MIKNKTIIPSIIAVLMLLIAAFFRLPYDYYTLLRWVICGIASYIAYMAYEEKRQEWTWIMIVIALVFNPIFKTHLSRETWFIIDIVTAGIFGGAIYFIVEHNKE